MPDWSVLDEEGIIDVCRRASYKMARQYGLTIEQEDAEQEAYLILARNAERVRKQLKDYGLGVVYHELICDLMNSVQTQAKHRAKHTSLDAGLDRYLAAEA